MKKNKSNALITFILMLGIFISYFQRIGIENIELKFYDFYSSLRTPKYSGSEIVLIEIDDESISKIGRWPWERSKIAELINQLNSNENFKPALIGLNILFSEREDNKLQYVVEKIEEKYKDLISRKKIKETTKESEFILSLEELKNTMDNDRKLKVAISSAGNVMIPMFFEMAEINSKPAEEPEYFKSSAITLNQNSQEELTAEASNIILPIPELASAAAGIGHVNIITDIDGTIRRHLPFIVYNNNIYPSLAVMMAAFYAGQKPKDIILNAGNNFKIGKQTIPLDSESSMYIAYNTNDKPFKSYSFYDIINNKIGTLEDFKNKIVLIGLTAHGLGTNYVTPVKKSMSNLEQLTNIIQNLLYGDFISIPHWATTAEILSILITGLFAIIALPLLKAAAGAIISFILLALLIGTSFYLFVYHGMWIKMTYASVLLLTSYIFIITKRFFSTEKKKELIEISQIETNKMLGLSFQGQGMLDLAFEKFRLCPVDANMKELLYNLALDFERKRQFNKAKVVYEHIAEKDPDYKDIKNKIEILKKAADGAVFASPVTKGKENTILIEGANALPTLGRYEVIKELGKGAMGIVYLGRDPKINRTVAIKTMRFEEGMDEKEMKALKERFFREAQAAGNLSHPNIVKIYDAGEDQDIAYMAMELLKGEDLKKYTSRENLLPVDKVLSYIYQTALALDYAHKNGVIHRDIKPANIMILEDGTLRVTDFGIARIQESSKTATGTVMGTPYYMSPEQIAGKKVDGRADLFSLGVTMYELLTGERPWKGGESVATLFYQITNEGYPDIREYRKELSPDISKVIEKALKKNPDERYRTGQEMANDIKKILENRDRQNSSIPPEISKNQAKKENPKPASQNSSSQIISPKATLSKIPETKISKPNLKLENQKMENKPAQANASSTQIPTNPKPAKLIIEKEPKTIISDPKSDVSENSYNEEKKHKVPKTSLQNGIQLPINETPNQAKNINNFEKTLPLIYPEEGGKNESKN